MLHCVCVLLKSFYLRQLLELISGGHKVGVAITRRRNAGRSVLLEGVLVGYCCCVTASVRALTGRAAKRFDSTEAFVLHSQI